MKRNDLLGFFPFACLLAVCLFGCRTKSPDAVVKKQFPGFMKQGHRGARGLMPENTIPAMKVAVDEGANILEVDVHISKDRQVVVAHDPKINPAFTLSPNGEEISREEAEKYVLHQMDYADIRKFDVGSKFHSGYPEQRKLKVHMPLLGELIDSVEAYTAAKKLPKVIYNIEIKAEPKYDNIYQPKPEELVKLVMDVINERKIKNRFYIQSFDVRQIQAVHRHYPQVITGFLTSDKNASLEENISTVGFLPQIYSPHYKLVTKELVEESHKKGMKLVPWTVNSLEEIRELQQMGVDGIITDYPNLLNEQN